MTILNKIVKKAMNLGKGDTLLVGINNGNMIIKKEGLTIGYILSKGLSSLTSV